MDTFVTGGTGFIGSTLARRLVARGDDVTVLVRSRAKADEVLEDLDAAVVVGDVTTPESYAGDLAGVDRVYHTAAYFREYYGAGDHWERLRAVNVEGTRDLLVAADRAGVEGVVHVSSTGTIGHGPRGLPGDETTPPDPVGWENGYFRSKLVADALVEGYVAASDLRVVTVYPGVTLGPGDHSLTPGNRLVLETLTGDLTVTFDGGSDFVDVRDVAAGMVLAGDHGTAGDGYVLSTRYLSLPELGERVAALAGGRPPRTLPYPAVYAAAVVAERWADLTGTETLLTRAGVGVMRARLAVDATRARTELGLAFRPMEETLVDTAAWFAENGHAPGVTLASTGGAPVEVRP